MAKRLFTSNQQCKRRFKKLNPTIVDINEKSLLLVAKNMHNGLIEFGINDYEPSNLKKVNAAVFRKEEENYPINENINALFLISMIIIDM